MPTPTTTYALSKPTVGGDDNAWGTEINSALDKIDDLLDGTTAIKPNLDAGLWKVGGVAVTSSAAELNILDGVTASTAELNILDGVTASTAELNILDGVTASTAELNILDGATLTVTELNYVDGVTSAIQTQIDAKYDSGDLASQAEAEAGTDNTKLMTPLRVAQSVTALGKTPSYQSAEQAVTAASNVTLTHGLGGLPANVQAWLVCKVSDGGYSVDDWLGPIGSETFGDGANNGIVIAMNATQIKVQIGSQSIAMPSWSTGSRFSITTSSWRLVVRAWK